MKIYLAAMYGEMMAMRKIADDLAAAGHAVTSRWVFGAEDTVDETADGAIMDLADVDAADCVMSFTLPRGTSHAGGGRHVEFGYAIAKGKRLVVIGHRETIFHHLPLVEIFDDTTAAIAAISKET